MCCVLYVGERVSICCEFGLGGLFVPLGEACLVSTCLILVWVAFIFN